MVSSGNIQSDSSSLNTSVKNVSSILSGLSGSWEGESFSAISSKVDSEISEILTKVTSQMETFSSACGLLSQYEEVKAQLATARSNYNSASQENKSKYSSQISTLETKIQELKTQIEGLLASIGGEAVSSSSGTTTTPVVDAEGIGSISTSSLGTPTYGSFTRQVYTTSSGEQIPYMCYIPNYGTGSVPSGLSVHMYLTGANMKGSGESVMTYGGVGKLLNEKSLNPSGIVIIPYINNGHQLEKQAFRSQLTEMAVNIAKEYNADTNKISLGGHSYGAITAYRMVNENPNVFSAIVPVSGSSKITNAESFKNVKIWAFHGARDNPGNNTNYTQAVQIVQQLQSMGVNATLHAYEDYPNCYHTHTANTTFSSTFESPEGENINPLEWAFKQSKA